MRKAPFDIKLFKLDSLRYTPFDQNFIQDDFDYLLDHGLAITEKKQDADIFLASSKKQILKNWKIHFFSKPSLIWTNEPRVSTTSRNAYHFFGILPKIHIMNIYTGDVFINNVTYQEKRFKVSQKLEKLPSPFKFKNKRIAALMSYYNGGKDSKIIVNGSNIDLIKLRSEIALAGLKFNIVDIFGKGWPAGVSKEDSRSGHWGERKRQLLQSYHFNLCFENTVYPHYISEKIWDSIENYCLPIYYGGIGSSIYEIFPTDSFLDYANFGSAENLFSYLEKMKEKEFVKRMNLCIDIYNGFSAKPESFWNDTKQRMLNNIVEKCNLIIN